MAAKTRIIGFDIAKCIAMFFVVMLHYSFYTRFYSSGIAGTLVTTACVVCVPLFFAVNGALLLPRPLNVRKHYHRMLMILAVMAVWKVIVSVFYVVVDRSHPAGLRDALVFQLGGAFSDYPVGYFWFLYALVAVYAVYPMVKALFDEPSGIALKSTMVVLLTFTVGKDTLLLILQTADFWMHLGLTPLLGSVDEFYLFGKYGYVLLYFLVGGIIGRSMVCRQDDGGISVRWPFAVLSPKLAALLTVVCYVVTFGIQRLQHHMTGVGLTVDNGYRLLPTFIATVLVLALCLHVQPTRHARPLGRRLIECVGANTLGIYMLHLMALVVLYKLQARPQVAALFQMQSHVALTLVNVGFALLLFLCCLLISVAGRRLPLIRHLFVW